ncbi:MAG TPA: LysR substrate-binding domain-containing protein, partial [Nakamurella sp.]
MRGRRPRATTERENGVTLFERSSRSVRMAPAGSVLLRRARAVLAELEIACAELAGLAGVVTGRLRLGMIGSATSAAPMVEQALAAFHRGHPGVEITMADPGSGLMAEQIRSGAMDLAFVGLFADQVPADLVHRVLAVEPLVAVVGPDHPFTGRTVAVDLAELAGFGAFVEMRGESGVRRQVDAAFSRARVTRTVAFELSTSDAVVRFVGLGFGAAVVPRSAVGSRPDVTTLPLRDDLARHPV